MSCFKCSKQEISKKMRIKITFSIFVVIAFLFVSPLFAQVKQDAFSKLTDGEILHGFKVTAVYLNDADQPMGARFIHGATGFTLDLLQIESVPQTFIYVNTYPVSDKGEPHTQEHLLITKGNKGHELNTREGMSLAESNAFTSQLHTAYNFNTGAGAEVFYTLFEGYLDALLYPNYTDEEVRREVRNWGVVQSPDKTLRLEEKGSVYNEMFSTMNNPYELAFDTAGRILYGNAHPLSYNAGGSPAGIRILNEKDIAKYHQDNYYLGNMGSITSLPKSMEPDEVLERMNRILLTLARGVAAGEKQDKLLPRPEPAEPGKISVIDVPSENAQQAGMMLFAYPPELDLDPREYLELSNFLTVFGGDATTNLYKLFIDSKTRQQAIDAQTINSWVDDKQLHPVFFLLDGIKTENLTLEKANLARQSIISELEKVAAYPDHSPELIAFNERFENSLISTVRSNAKFENSPPKFGFRNTGDEWYTELNQLDKVKGFKKSIGLKPQIQEIRTRMAGATNIWKEDIAKWKLTSVLPYVVVTRANTELNDRSEAARKARADEEVARLKNVYQLNNDQETIARYKAVYDSNTLVLEKEAQAVRVKFIDNPPLTLDDELNFKQEKLKKIFPVVVSVFNNMTSATTGIALNLNSVPAEDLVYLALFPELLTETGYIKNGKGVPYEEMIQQIQQQILSLNSYYSTGQKTNRVELVIKASGNNVTESQLSVEWISRVLKSPYWRTENLPRIRDLVEQELTDIRKKMQGAEEDWVGDPDRAYEKQDKPLFLATSSFLTRSHNIFRLKWMLKETKSKTDSAAISRFFSSLAEATGSRSQLTNLLTGMSSGIPISADSAGVNISCVKSFIGLPAGAKILARDAAIDLLQILNEVPDGSLKEDWEYLCKTLQHDLATGPEKTLKSLNKLRESLLNENNTRFFLIGSEKTEQSLNPALERLVTGFSHQSFVNQNYTTERLIDQRVKHRLNTNDRIVFAGLINPDSHTGVFENSAPLVGYKDTQRNELLKYLAAELYAGGGKQSVYTKTIGAGLSYSTGVGASAGRGRFIYYAERTPELPQTLGFVINEIKHSPIDTTMLDYVVSLGVGSFRSADDYESRGEAMAVDLNDGTHPEMIRTFRKAILQLRKEPGLIYEIYKYKDPVYEKILPGYGIPSKDVAGGSFFVIGPEKQMVAYQAYLKSVNGTDTKLYRLYPRDFWMTK
jgi:Zn-dependent M16 (insulinase) family peptidase